MKLHRFNHFASLALAVACSVFCPCAAAQNSWDRLEVTDGNNPTLRYGFYSEPSGQSKLGRYYFVDNGKELTIWLAPYGRPVVELPVHSYDRKEGVIKLGWSGKEGRSCTLQRYSKALFLGNCREPNSVMPMAIRFVSESDYEMMGLRFPTAAVDVAILERAKKIFMNQSDRNLNGDRNCVDDMKSGHYSVFCSMYAASIEVDGVYRHRRPAMRALRKSLTRQFPGDYVHRLRDINNDRGVTNEQILAAFDDARERLIAEIQRIGR